MCSMDVIPSELLRLEQRYKKYAAENTELKRQLREQNEEMKLLKEDFDREIAEYEERQAELDEKEVDLFYREEKLKRKELEINNKMEDLETLQDEIRELQQETVGSVNTKLKNDERQLRL